MKGEQLTSQQAGTVQDKIVLHITSTAKGQGRRMTTFHLRETIAVLGLAARSEEGRLFFSVGSSYLGAWCLGECGELVIAQPHTVEG